MRTHAPTDDCESEMVAEFARVIGSQIHSWLRRVRIKSVVQPKRREIG